MAEIWGRAKIIVTADGDLLVTQTKAIAEKAGDEGGVSFADSFDKSAGKGLKGSLDGFKKSFKEWDKNLKDSDKNMSNLGRRTRAFFKTIGNTTPMLRFRLALSSIFKGGGGDRDGFFKSIGGGLKNISEKFGDLSHNARQWILIIAAVLAGFEQMATLGAAAGAGILILGGALAQGLVGVTALIVAFSALTGELDKISPALRPAAEAFQSIGDAFKRLQQSVAEGALAGSADAFNRIRDAVDALIPAFAPLERVIAGLVEDFSLWAQAATGPFGTLTKLVEQSAPTFDGLARATGKFVDALLIAFTNDKMQEGIAGLVGWLDDLASTFQEFVQTDEFVTWLDNGMRILKAFGGLLEDTGRMLDRLVTPESVERTIAFLENLGGAMEFIGELTSVLGELDIFGLIAQLLNDVGNALNPVLELLRPVAQVINDLVSTGLTGLAAALQFVTPLFAPLQIAFNLIAAVVEVVTTWFTAIYEQLGIVGGGLQAVTDQIISAFNPAIEAIADAVEAMLPSPEEFANFVQTELIPAIQDIAHWIETDLVPAIQDFANWIRTDAIPAIKDFVKWFNEDVGPVLEDVARWLKDAGTNFDNFAKGVKQAVDIMVGPIKWAIDLFNQLTGAAGKASYAASASAQSARTAARPMARGGILNGPAHILAGEAGREAFVPLDRPLGAVDPSVRWLSALAQGKSTPMASGGIVGGGRSLTVDPGAITILDSGDPRRTANAMITRLVEYAVG